MCGLNDIHLLCLSDVVHNFWWFVGWCHWKQDSCYRNSHGRFHRWCFVRIIFRTTLNHNELDRTLVGLRYNSLWLLQVSLLFLTININRTAWENRLLIKKHLLLSRTFEWDYLPFRLWIGVWTSLFLFIILATDATVYISYITRFTEESFATLVALIFIKKALQKVIQVCQIV